MEYRLYRLEGDRIREAESYECNDDAEAIVAALDRADGRAMELWEGARVVKKFPATPRPAGRAKSILLNRQLGHRIRFNLRPGMHDGNRDPAAVVCHFDLGRQLPRKGLHDTSA